MYYFVYHINTIALYWQEKSTLLLNESCRFLLSAAWNAITKATEYVTFSFSFRILVFLPFWQSLNVTVCKRYGFFSVLAAILRTNPDKRPWIENSESFAVHSSLAEWRERQETHQLLIGDIKHSWKKNTRYIFTSVVATLLRAFHINHSLYEKSHLSRGIDLYLLGIFWRCLFVVITIKIKHWVTSLRTMIIACLLLFSFCSTIFTTRFA